MNNLNLSLKSLSADEINKIEEFRKSNRTAVLAILFSDIVNSTHATEKLGEQAFSKLRHIHDELFKRIMCRDQAGIIIKEIGDSFLCVFAEPSTAVLRAVEFQRAIHANKENLTAQGYTLSVKIGIHVGQVAVENSLALDIFGRHVNRAARIEAIAKGGQILASHSAWENAVGWLKDNDKGRIGWIFYGRTKLKGIDEKTDIYGFYPEELDKPPVPEKIQSQKRNKTILMGVILVTVITAVFILFKQSDLRKEITSKLKGKKSFYVQFDFSEFRNQQNYSQNLIDTNEITEALLSQIIAVINPDSVVTESDLLNLSSRQGRMYVRRDFNREYYYDTLQFIGALFIKGIKNQILKKDSITLDYLLALRYDDGGSWIKTDDLHLNLQNIKKDFKNWFGDMFIQFWANIDQGFVVECNDSIMLFKISGQANLRVGAEIKVLREYRKTEGLNLWIVDREKKIEYLKDKSRYAEELKDEIIDYERRKPDVTDALTNDKSGWIFGVDITGKVVELYDSIGKATWKYDGIFPFEKPRKGDVLRLDY